MARTQPAPDGATTGLTRRQLLERSAVMGGAVLAAQSLGAVSAFAQNSAPPPPPPPPNEPPEIEYPSNFQLAVRVNGGPVYGVKYDGSWDKIGNDGTCLSVAYDRKTPDSVLNLFAGSVSKVNGAYVLAVPAGVQVLQAATHDGTYDNNNCSAPVSPSTNGTYSFTKNAKN